MDRPRRARRRRLCRPQPQAGRDLERRRARRPHRSPQAVLRPRFAQKPRRICRTRRIATASSVKGGALTTTASRSLADRKPRCHDSSVNRIHSMLGEVRYEEDFYAWTQDQARLLRSVGGLSDNRLDREQVAEEIEDLGKSERDAVRSQIRRILEHFLKLQFSPAQAPRYDWMASIAD